MRRLLLALFATLTLPLTAGAQDVNLFSESAFLYDFDASGSGEMWNGSIDAYDGCYSLTVNNTMFFAEGGFEDFYDGRGFRSTATIGSLVVTRHAYVPELGLSFARYIDVVENTGVADATVTFAYYCDLGSDGGETLDSSDDDANAESTDEWVASDDIDNAGDPSLSHIFQQDGATYGLSSMVYAPNSLSWSYQIDIPAGGQAAVMIYGVQEQTRALARSTAVSLAALEAESLDATEDEINDVMNFNIGPADAPRLRANGPYHVDEGGTIDLDVTVTDPNGDPVTFTWDLDNNGTYGDLPNDATPTIDAADADGPSTLRVGIEMSDGTNIVQRLVSVQVQNLVPEITSTPPTDATTDEPYSYPVVAVDIPGDVLTYSLDQAPLGMTVSAAGLVQWTPTAGQSPDVPVTVLVTDDDGGETEQVWTIRMHGGPTLIPGGPYRVAEGSEIVLRPVIEDPEGDELTYAWDLDGDGVYDDEDEATATWSAAGIDGPASGFEVRLSVSDGTYDVIATIPVEVQNAPPEFTSSPSSAAVVGREWTYTVQAYDPGDDDFEITPDPDDMPPSMTYDPATQTFLWVPNAADLVAGVPAGHHQFTITAEDTDNGRTRQDVSITIGENSPPPVPVIKYPDGTETVRSAQPTILLDNVVDPDGDPVQYFLEVDYDPCFCSPEHQASGALAQGALVTEWALPRAFNVDTDNGGHIEFYVRRWASDGIDESAKELSLYRYEAPEGDGGGDADADSDGDADADDESAGCACHAPGSAPRFPLFAALALAGLLWRRRRGRHPTRRGVAS